jgi:hypothetical protein
MTWDAIGSIGEIVSAVAVLITLIYLASQIRLSNQIAKNEAELDIRNQVHVLHGNVLSSPETAGVLAKLRHNQEDLSPAEIELAISFAKQNIQMLMSVEHAFNNGLLSRFSYGLWLRNTDDTMNEYPGIVEPYNIIANTFGVRYGLSESFDSIIDALVKRGYSAASFE